MEKYGYMPYAFMSNSDIKFFKILAESESIEDALSKLKMNEKKFGEKLARLSKKGILPSRPLSFVDLKKYSMAVISRNEFIERIKRIEKEIKELKNLLKEIAGK